MACNWAVRYIGELGKVITGRTPPSTNPEYFGHEVPFLTPTDMDGRRTQGSTARSLSRMGTDFLKRILVHRGVAVSCIGWQMGKAVLITRPTVTNQQINTLVVDPRVADELFLYYSFLAKRKEIFALGAGGSRTPILNKSGFQKLKVLLPCLEEQRAIGRFLGTFDERIELLKQTNETLQALARAIFKSWFVDFDPVKAKCEGRDPEGMNAAIAALFPDGFQNCEFGAIPIGWRVGQLSEIAEIIDCLHSKKPDRMREGKPLIQLWNIRDDGLLDMSDIYWIAKSDYIKWISRMEARGGDCVITNVGRVGAVAQVPENYKAALGRNMTGIRCHQDFSYPTFLIQALTSDVMKREIANRTDAGTILESLNVRSIPRLRLVIPQNELLQCFEAICRPLRRRMELNLNQVQNLTAVRDSLLPFLVSGRVRLPEDRLAEVTA